MNPKQLFQMKAAWDQVNKNHPKLLPFIKAVQAAGLEEGTVIEVKVTTPEDKTMTANIKLKQSDIDLLKQARESQGK